MRPRPRGCGRSGPMARAWPGAPRRAANAGPAGRTPPCPRRSSAPTCATSTCSWSSTGSPGSPSDTSGTAASTCAWTSRSRPRALRRCATSWRVRPNWSTATAGHSLANTGMGVPARSCCPRCTRRRRSRCSRRSSISSTPRGCSIRACSWTPTRWTRTCVVRRRPSAPASAWPWRMTTATCPRPSTAVQVWASAVPRRSAGAAGSCAPRTPRPRTRRT